MQVTFRPFPQPTHQAITADDGTVPSPAGLESRQLRHRWVEELEPQPLVCVRPQDRPTIHALAFNRTQPVQNSVEDERASADAAVPTAMLASAGHATWVERAAGVW
eukprot:CAMPEP_0181169068 /NCGR_PEP_ID=MMETSP1096-20121128/614_1 /TAXON_ID=156174 ORGANISM="Chrysochromulina ericina, Strain CCMP281" /NCGR_SAMPLE_ID=MMETSP1096 /ASSEMBLY_ACC=CAM_ASM_000453 /LENGTH=105 /DNA_ID=CAMNT_0023256495 /DNA_START=74 /DNA_END=389 /DNA_ORIENTATION=+